MLMDLYGQVTDRSEDTPARQSPADTDAVELPMTHVDTSKESLVRQARQQAAIEGIRQQLSNSRSERPTTEDPDQAARTSTDMIVKMPLLEKPGMADQEISLDLGKVPIMEVVRLVSDTTGINFVWAEETSDTIGVSSPTPIKLRDLYGYLETLLEVKGFAAIPAGDVVKIVRRQAAASYNLPVRIGIDPSQIPLTDTTIVQMMQLQHAAVTEIAQIIRPRLPQAARMDIYARDNKLIITDTSSNIHQIARLIQELDVPDAKTDTVYIPLVYASATEMSKQITEILNHNDPASSGARPRPNQSPTPEVLHSAIHVKADPRTNLLIVTANPSDTERVLELIAQLDVEKPSGSDNYHVVPLIYANAKDLSESLTQGLPDIGVGEEETGLRPRITADESTNSLIVTAQPHHFAVIHQVIKQLDIARDQVWVDALIIEISEDDLQEIGIDWATLDDAVADSVRGFGVTNFGPRVDFLNGNAQGLSIGAFKNVGGDDQITAILNALQRNSDVNILSQPSIMTTNHQEAEIVIADNIPVVKDSRITETDLDTPTVIQTFEYEDVGVKLKITPHTSTGQWMRLELNFELSKVVEGREGQSVDTPTTSKRTVTTGTSVLSGDTIIIGGLIRDDKVQVVQQVPLLGDIPLLGELFKWRREQIQKTNLVIFITPHLLGNPGELAQMTQTKVDEIQPQLEAKWIDDAETFQSGKSIWK